MNKRKALLCLFATVHEIKQSFEHPVIFLTHADFSEDIIHSSIDLRTALLQKAPHRIIEIVNTFHNQWLQAVQDVEIFKKRVKDTPRESIFKSIQFTIDSAKKRHMDFQKYLNDALPTLEYSVKKSLQSESTIIEDMLEILQCVVNDKHQCLHNTADKKEFLANVAIEADELLTWLDKQYGNLAKEFCKVLDLNVSLSAKLTKTLHEVIDEVARYSTTEAKRVAQELDRKDKTLCSFARITTSSRNEEIVKVKEKIQCLEERITQMKNDISSVDFITLQHKALFLNDRLVSLKNLKLSLRCLINRKSHCEYNDDAETFHDIFDHLLPHQKRSRLIGKLVRVWKAALSVTDYKLTISMPTTVDPKEVYVDDIGYYTIDKYGMKSYKLSGTETYQPSEQSSPVAGNYDDKHVFFYDKIGRYYKTDNSLHVYKAHSFASEYMLHKSGMLLKLSEVEDGVKYRYDNLGRYYIDRDGGRVYRDTGSSEEYRHNGFGALVKIRDSKEMYEKCSYSCNCPMEPMVVEECKYLKDTIGDALKKCLAEIVMVQPEDPIKYLAGMLVKYRHNMEAKENKLISDEILMGERQRLAEIIPSRRSQTSFEILTPQLTLTYFDEQSVTDSIIPRHDLSEII